MTALAEKIAGTIAEKIKPHTGSGASGASAAEVFQRVAHVREVTEGAFLVENEEGRYRARRATSCLIEPAVGDLALMVGPPEGELYILGILERSKEPGPLKIRPEGDLVIEPSGRFAVASKEGIHLASGGDLSLTAKETLRVGAGAAELLLDQVRLLSRRVLAQVEQGRITGGILDAVVERLSLKATRAYRFVEEMDTVRAKNLDYRAEQNAQVRGENAMVLAKNLVKLDGGHIHMG